MDHNILRLRKFSPELTLQNQIILECPQINGKRGSIRPAEFHGMGTDQNENIYVLKVCHYISREGIPFTISVDIFDQNLLKIKSIALDWKGEQFFNGRVQTFTISDDGKNLFAFDSENMLKINLESQDIQILFSRKDRINFPLKFYRDPQGRFYVIDHIYYMTEVMRVFTADGTLIKTFGDSADLCPCSEFFLNPESVYFQGDSVYVQDGMAKHHGGIYKTTFEALAK